MKAATSIAAVVAVVPPFTVTHLRKTVGLIKEFCWVGWMMVAEPWQCHACEPLDAGSNCFAQLVVEGRSLSLLIDLIDPIAAACWLRGDLLLVDCC